MQSHFKKTADNKAVLEPAEFKTQATMGLKSWLASINATIMMLLNYREIILLISQYNLDIYRFISTYVK